MVCSISSQSVSFSLAAQLTHISLFALHCMQDKKTVLQLSLRTFKAAEYEKPTTRLLKQAEKYAAGLATIEDVDANKKAYLEDMTKAWKQ